MVESMTMNAEQPLDRLFERLRESLGELAPEPLLSGMKPVVEGFLAQFQLVPKREYDAHMATLSLQRVRSLQRLRGLQRPQESVRSSESIRASSCATVSSRRLRVAICASYSRFGTS